MRPLPRIVTHCIAPSSIAATLLACGSSTTTPGFQPTDGSVNAPSDASIDVVENLEDSSGPSFAMDASAPDSAANNVTLPANFVPTEHGGYALGAAILADGSGDAGVTSQANAGGCGLVLGVVRDFKSYGIQTDGHPDFEHFLGLSPTLGLVTNALGADEKPIFGNKCDTASAAGCLYGQQTTTQANFDQWYRYTAGVNLPFLIYLEFVPNGTVYTFESKNYFPLDKAGFGTTPGLAHNFSFTTELHLTFKYNGGETFKFSGDDDLWVYINGKLVMDIGGTHPSASGTLNVDSVGLKMGEQYPIDIFNAERHTSASDVRIDTNLAFTDCGKVPPDIPK